MIGPLDVLAGFVPGLLWLFWVYRKDRHEPEPVPVLLRVFLLGCVAALFVIDLRPRAERLMPSDPGLASDLVDAFLVTAFVEEAFKLLAFYFGALWHRDWDQPLDGIVYGAAAGLGFASVENAVYFAIFPDASVLLGRSFTATLVHMVFSGTAGLMLGYAKLRGGRWAALLGGAGFAAAVLLHGSYDALLLVGGGLEPLALLVLLPALCVLLGLQVRWATRVARPPEAGRLPGPEGPSAHAAPRGR